MWLHVVLRSLAPGGKDFPEFGAGHEQRLANLRRLVNRAKRYGIGVYLYMNEPRAMPLDFFKNRPQMAGVVEGDYRAMCTSDPGGAGLDGRRAGLCVSRGPRPGRRLHHYRLREPHQLRQSL